MKLPVKAMSWTIYRGTGRRGASRVKRTGEDTAVLVYSDELWKMLNSGKEVRDDKPDIFFPKERIIFYVKSTEDDGDYDISAARLRAVAFLNDIKSRATQQQFLKRLYKLKVSGALHPNAVVYLCGLRDESAYRESRDLSIKTVGELLKCHCKHIDSSLTGCPLMMFIMKDIASSGQEGDYDMCRDLDRPRNQNAYTVCVLGGASAGKATFIKRLEEWQGRTCEKPKIDVPREKIITPTKGVSMRIVVTSKEWITEGYVRTKGLDVAIVLFDHTKETSFQYAKDCTDELLRDTGTIRAIFLAGNKHDLNIDQQSQQNDNSRKLSEIDNFIQKGVKYTEISAETESSVDTFIFLVIEELKSGVQRQGGSDVNSGV